MLSLVAALAALATVGRIAFAPFPNVKPTTDIALFAGYALGPVPGFTVGAVAALASNVFFGQGPLTPWQMVGVGRSPGVLGGLLAALDRAGASSGAGRSRWRARSRARSSALLMDAYQWTQGAGQDLAHYLAVSATSLPYNAAHVIGNVAFCLLLGPSFVRALRRYRRRFEVRWAPAGGRARRWLRRVVALCAARAQASTASRAAAYVAAAQNADGGFGGVARRVVHPAATPAGPRSGSPRRERNPATVSRRLGSSVDRLRARQRAGSLTDMGELERTMLVLRAAGLSARSFDGRDLVAELLRRRSRSGSWKATTRWTAVRRLALRARRRQRERAGALARRRTRDRDGGFGFQPGAASDADDTGAVLQALGGRRAAAVEGRAARGGVPASAAERRRRLRAVRRRRLERAVDRLGSAGPRRGRGQPELAAPRLGRTPLTFIGSLQAADGSIRYSRTSRADAGVGDRAGARRARAQAVPAARGGAPAGGGAESGGSDREREQEQEWRWARERALAAARPQDRRASQECACCAAPARRDRRAAECS